MREAKFFGILAVLVLITLAVSGCTSDRPITEMKYTSCETDEECRLVDKNIGCSICSPCSIDYASDNMIAANLEMFTEYEFEWRKENCPKGFVDCLTDQGTIMNTDECRTYLICPTCETVIKNSHFEAKCVNNVCTKVGELETCGEMSLDEAKEIALASECAENGTLKDTYMCNEDTETWWIDLDIEKPGCSPACVVHVETKQAEINWRCTGLLPG